MQHAPARNAHHFDRSCQWLPCATLFVGIKNMAGDVFLHYTISTYMTVITSADFTSVTLSNGTRK